MGKMPKPENIAKLTEEQREIYEIWAKEKETTTVLLEKAVSALESGDQETATACFWKLDKLIPNMCEHDRSVWDHCADCEAIERVIYPDDFNANGDRLDEETLYNRTLN